MLTKRIIPCLDVMNGRVVKGINFVELRDAGDPVEQATRYNDEGADEICYLDISASPEGKSTMIDVVERTAESLFVPLTVGGGVRSVDDACRLLDAGADKVAINTAAIRDPDLVSRCARRFGHQAIVVAVDAKWRDETEDYEIYSHGGRTPEGLEAIAWCKNMADCGAGEILLTSMDRDGTGKGYELRLLDRVISTIDIPVIASGGVGGLPDLADGFRAGASAVLAASIFHYGHHSITDAKDYLLGAGIPVRPLQ